MKKVKIKRDDVGSLMFRLFGQFTFLMYLIEKQPKKDCIHKCDDGILSFTKENLINPCLCLGRVVYITKHGKKFIHGRELQLSSRKKSKRIKHNKPGGE